MPSASFSDSRYRLDYSCSYVQQDKANNRSLFRRVLNIVKVGAASGWSNNTSYWSIAGPVNNPSGSFTYNFGNYSELLLYYADVWVGHNADGTLSFTTSASVSADTPLGSASIGSFWVSAPTIVNAPDAPSGQSVTRNSDTQATVTWTRNSSGNKAWTGVYIDRWSVTTQTWARVATVTGTGTSWVDDNITANNQYKYRVASYNSAGTSTYVETNTIITTPAAPITVVAEKQANLDIVISWVNQAAYPTLVDIYDNGVKVGSTASTGLSDWTHVGPNTAVTHTYTLKAVSGSLSSDFSSASNTVQLQAPPLAPADVKFNYPVVDVGNVMPRPVLSWRHNPVDASTQTKRRLRFRKQGTSTWTTDTIWTTSSQETTNNEIVTDLGDYFGYLPGVYEFQVMTWGAHATGSPWSNTAVITLESNPNVAIISPTPGQVVDRSRLTVEWTYSQAQSRPQQKVSFVLENTLTGQVAWSGDITGTATTYQIPYTLIDGQSYTLKLTAYSNTGVPTVTQQVINFSIDYAEPLLPVLIGSSEDSLGTHQLTISNPSSGEPVVANRVYRNVKQGSDWMKLTGNPVPSETINYAPSLYGATTPVEVYKNYAPSLYGPTAPVEVYRNYSRYARNPGSWNRHANVVITPVTDSRFKSSPATKKGAGWVTFPSALGSVVAGDVVTLSVRHTTPDGLPPAAVYAGFGGGTPPPGTDTTGVIDHGDGTFTSWRTRVMTGSGYVEQDIGAAPSSVVLTFGDPMVVKSSVRVPYFDGAYSPDPDMTARWIGAANATESVLEGQHPTGFNDVGCVSIIHEVGDGTRELRQIPKAANNNSYTAYNIPATGTLRADGTSMATLRLPAPQAGTPYAYARSVWADAPSQITPRSPNVAGTYQHRLHYTNLTSAYRTYLFAGGASGSGDVYWSNIGLYEGDYQGPFFDEHTGSPDPDMVFEQKSGYVALVGQHPTGFTDSSCVSIIHETPSGDRKLRLIPTGIAESWARSTFEIPAGLRASGTLSATRKLSSAASANWKNALRVDLPTQLVGSDNNLSEIPLSIFYGALTSFYQAQLSGGDGVAGSGDVYWSEIGLYKDNYSGPFFDGNTPGYTDTDGMVVTHSYKNGLSVETRSYPEFRAEEWELVGEYPPNVTIIDKQGLSRGKTAYRVEAISGIPSISASAIVLTADSPWVWIGAGNNFELTLGIPWNFALSLTAGLVEDELFWFDGRDKPVSVTGTARSQTLSVSGTLDPTGQEGSTWEQLQEFFMTPGLKIYRDRDGRRVYGSIKSGSQARGNQNSGRTNKRNKYDVSFIVEEADNVGY